MAINLSTTPSLGSMVISRGGVWRYSIGLPSGQAFPLDTEVYVVVSDRAGVELLRISGEVTSSEATFFATGSDLDDIPAGSNFEIFVELEGDPYKVRYGRVVRHEAEYPLSPLSNDIFVAAMYEDDMQRSNIGPYWVPKHGRVAMFANPDPKPDYSMAVRNLSTFLPLTLWADASVVWYAPLRSDTVTLSVGLMDGGDGVCIVGLCSNYLMTNWLGVKFHDTVGPGDYIQIITGTGPQSYTAVGSTYAHIVPDNGDIYTIKYSLPTNTVSVYIGSGLTPVLEWTDTSHVITHGEGHRYMGLGWTSTFANTGPRVYYWKAKDDV